MSVETLRNIARELEARTDAIGSLDEGLALLLETTQTLARHMAELVFLKVQTEPGWTPDEARGLAERALDGHARAIAESVHANGGSLQLADQLGVAAFDAFRERLAELGTSRLGGGRA
jgi:predicted RNase H-like HicB family nuclease